MTIKLLKKISAATVLGNLRGILEGMDEGEEKPAYGVAGICEAYEKGVTNIGEWTRFVGELEAVNYISGEISRAPKAHVPDLITDILLQEIGENSTIVESKSNPKTQTVYYQMSNDVEFSYVVNIKRLPDDPKDGGLKHEWVPIPKTETAPNERIAHLTSLINPDGVAQLSPPKKAPKKAPPKKAPPKKKAKGKK